MKLRLLMVEQLHSNSKSICHIMWVQNQFSDPKKFYYFKEWNAYIFLFKSPLSTVISGFYYHRWFLRFYKTISKNVERIWKSNLKSEDWNKLVLTESRMTYTTKRRFISVDFLKQLNRIRFIARAVHRSNQHI